MKKEVFKITLITDGDESTIKVDSDFEDGATLISVIIEIMRQDDVLHNIFTQAVCNFYCNEELRNYLGLEFDGGVLFSDPTEEE